MGSMFDRDRGLPVPGIGNWYKDLTGQQFEIVAMDEQSATLEIQFFDGTVEEIEFGNWEEFVFAEIEPPEDWSGSMDLAREDFSSDFDDLFNEERRNPLDFVDRL